MFIIFIVAFFNKLFNNNTRNICIIINEIHQIFISVRIFQIKGILIDDVGSIIGIYLFKMMVKKILVWI